MSKKKLTIGILSICMISALAIGGTLAFLTDSEKVTNTFSMGDLDISIDEPHWNDEGTPDDPTTTDTDESTPGDGEDLTPGDTKVKDPTVKAEVNDSYMRVVMNVIDKDSGEVITDTERLNLILQTIRYDNSYDAEGDPATTGINPSEKYKLADLADYPTVNTDFTLDNAKSTAGTYCYNYNEILKEGETAVLFTNVVIPTDWDQDELEVLGQYKIEVYAQAIQTDNFADADEAFAALDAEIEAGTVQYNYAIVGEKSDK